MAQVLDLLLLLPEDLAQLVRSKAHVLQHLTKLVHRVGRLVKHITPGLVIELKLIDLLAMRVDVTLVLLDFVHHVLGLQFGGAALLVHDLDCLLLCLDLAVDVLELAAQPLRSLLLCLESGLKLLVLHHLIARGATIGTHLRVEFALEVVEADVFLLLFLVLLVQVSLLVVQVRSFQGKLLCLGKGVVLGSCIVVSHLGVSLRLLHHAQFQTPDLILNVLVVLFKLATVHDLSHELLQLLVFHRLLVAVICEGLDGVLVLLLLLAVLLVLPLLLHHYVVGLLPWILPLLVHLYSPSSCLLNYLC